MLKYSQPPPHPTPNTSILPQLNTNQQSHSHLVLSFESLTLCHPLSIITQLVLTYPSCLGLCVSHTTPPQCHQTRTHSIIPSFLCSRVSYTASILAVTELQPRTHFLLLSWALIASLSETTAPSCHYTPNLYPLSYLVLCSRVSHTAPTLAVTEHRTRTHFLLLSRALIVSLSQTTALSRHYTPNLYPLSHLVLDSKSLTLHLSSLLLNTQPALTSPF